MTLTRLSRLAFAPLVGFIVLLTGCSGGPRVEGNVTLDGQPVDEGSITFIPEGSSGGSNAAGEIKGGKYAIISTANFKPGSYRVEIYWNKKTGKQIPNASDPGTTMEETRQVVPNEYNKNTKLKVDIKSGSNTHDFELKGGGR